MAIMVYNSACKNCGSSTRIEVIGQAAVPPGGWLSFFCPCCGANAADKRYTNGMNDDEYFYWLAESIGLPRTKAGAELTKQIFHSWDHDEYPKFRDYYQSLVDEEGEEK